MRATSMLHEASPMYLQLKAILSRYASTITVDGILASACARTRVPPSRLDRENLDRVVIEVRTGIRIFCDASHLPSVMQELSQLMRSPDAVD